MRLLVAHKLLRNEVLEPVYSLRSKEGKTLKALVNELNARAALGLNLEWAALPDWGGVVKTPWQGPVPPGWEPRIPVINELVLMATMQIPQKDKVI